MYAENSSKFSQSYTTAMVHVFGDVSALRRLAKGVIGLEKAVRHSSPWFSLSAESLAWGCVHCANSDPLALAWP